MNIINAQVEVLKEALKNKNTVIKNIFSINKGDSYGNW